MESSACYTNIPARLCHLPTMSEEHSISTRPASQVGHVGLSAGFEAGVRAYTCARGGITQSQRFFGSATVAVRRAVYIIKGSRAISKMQTSKGSLTTPRRGGVWACF